MTARALSLWVRAVPAALTCVLLTACGVQMQDAAEPLPGGAIPSVSAPTSEPVRAPRSTQVYFVSGRGLEPIAEPIQDRSANGVMAALAAGPVVRQSELRTLLVDPLTSLPVLVVTSVSPSGEAILQRTDAYLQMSAMDQVLLIGQVVHSLDEIGLSPVSIIDPAGVPVPLALPDGRQIGRAVTAADYASLLDHASAEPSE